MSFVVLECTRIGVLCLYKMIIMYSHLLYRTLIKGSHTLAWLGIIWEACLDAHFMAFWNSQACGMKPNTQHFSKYLWIALQIDFGSHLEKHCSKSFVCCYKAEKESLHVEFNYLGSISNVLYTVPSRNNQT